MKKRNQRKEVRMSRSNLMDVLKRKVKIDILKGKLSGDIIHKLMNDEYGYGKVLAKHHSEQIISDVKKQIREEWANESQYLRETQLERLVRLYADSLTNNDRQSALNTLKEINKITGQYEAQKMDINVNGEILVDFGFGDINDEDITI